MTCCRPHSKRFHKRDCNLHCRRALSRCNQVLIHPIAPQYPNGNATEHLPNISAFLKQVADGLSRITFPRPQHRYSSVHVLLISWADDDLGTAADIVLLQRIFQESYRFSATHFKIPTSNEPDFDLDEILSKTRNQYGRNEDGLLIIHYGGHSEIDKRTQHSIWKAWKSKPIGGSTTISPLLDWSELQNNIMKSKGDVLFILDCCYASGAMDSFERKRNGQRHFLLASGNDKSSNENTLTKGLIYELTELKAQPCTIFSLHTRLLENRTVHKWITAPIFTGMANGDTGIVLAPLPDHEASTSGDPSTPVSPEEDLALLKSTTRVLVSITLTEGVKQHSADSWLAWFRDHAPPSIAGISFPELIPQIATPNAVFSSDSIYMIFSLPVSVWNAMEPNDAIKFLSIVYSANLLHDQNDDEISEETAVAGPSLHEIPQDQFTPLKAELKTSKLEGKMSLDKSQQATQAPSPMFPSLGERDRDILVAAWHCFDNKLPVVSIPLTRDRATFNERIQLLI